MNHNVSHSEMLSVYAEMLDRELRMYEVVFTFKQDARYFKNVAECKKRAISIAKDRMLDTDPELGILTHELTEKGWSHIHAIIAYEEDNDSSSCLKGSNWREPLGIVSVYKCRTEEYEQVKPGPFNMEIVHKWDNHFDYIIKDQNINKGKLKDLNLIYNKKNYIPKKKELTEKQLKELLIDLNESLEYRNIQYAKVCEKNKKHKQKP